MLLSSQYADGHNGRVDDDPQLWLEDITGDDALEWVRRHNEPTLDELGGERFEQMRAEALEILDTDAGSPYVRRRGGYLYNYWRDGAHPRGLWRRTTLDQYRTDDPDWDVLVDLDALAAADDENWVWAGAEVIEPDYSLALVELSRGGSDATVVREFDLTTREFVDGGFRVDEAKTSISWEDHDTVLVGTDFGPPGSLTESGYPRVVKRWRRNQSLSEAQTVFEGVATDVSVGGVRPDPGGVRATDRLPVGRLLQPRILRDPRRRIGADRRPHRRGGDLDSPGVAADSAAHRMDGRDYDLPGRVVAGRQIRRVPLRHNRIGRCLRAGRTHQPRHLHLDQGPAGAGHLGRRRHPRRSRHPPRFVAPRTRRRPAGQRDDGDRRRR